MKTPQSVDPRERVLLVGVSLKRPPAGTASRARTAIGVASRDSLDELEELAESAGATIAGTLMQVRDSLDPATLVGPRQTGRDSRGG